MSYTNITNNNSSTHVYSWSQPPSNGSWWFTRRSIVSPSTVIQSRLLTNITADSWVTSTTPDPRVEMAAYRQCWIHNANASGYWLSSNTRVASRIQHALDPRTHFTIAIGRVNVCTWPVRERRNDQAARVAKILISILKLRIGLLGNAVVDVSVPVETQLLEPLERRRVRTARFHQLLDDVSRMHFDRHQRHHLQALVLRQVGAHCLRELVQHQHLPCKHTHIYHMTHITRMSNKTWS